MQIKNHIKKIVAIFIVLSLLSVYLPMLSLISFATDNITTLDTPVNLKWKDGSTATVTWDAVTNANYYNVNLYLYNNNEELLNSKETGTSSNELDIQQEINFMMNEKKINLKTFKISFEVIAVYLNDIETVMSNKSIESPKKQFEIGAGTIKLSAPTNVNVDNDYNATWTASTGADHYVVTFMINGNERTTYSECVFTSYSSIYSYGSTSNGIFKANIKRAIEDYYKRMIKYDYIQSGQTVALKCDVKACPSSFDPSIYIESDRSEYSNVFNYSGITMNKLATPTNVNVDESYNATWTASTGVDHYVVTFMINENERTAYSECVFTSYSSIYSYGTTSNGIFKANIKRAIEDYYKRMITYGYIKSGQTVTLKFDVKACPSTMNPSTYIESDKSKYSNIFNYSGITMNKLATPTNVNVDDDYNATWTASTGADHYVVTFMINGNERTTYGECVFTSYSSIYSYGTTSKGIFKANIKRAIEDYYNKMIRYGYIKSGQTVILKCNVKASPSSTNPNTYIESDKSEYSNMFYYNSDGTTKINKIILSPNKPVIAVGRSLYIGKTIEPDNAIYDKINWETSNKSIVTVSNLGQITGIKKGNATIKAQINNTVQTAEVSVYEIESSIVNKEEANAIIEKANDVIEAVITNGDITNTDIIDKDAVINEIEQGAEEGNTFNVGITYDNKTAEDYSDVKEQINSKFDGYNIAGGNDIKIEISHIDNNGEDHHIANITELENMVSVNFEIPSNLPKPEKTMYREYKLVRVHENEIEDINFKVNNGMIETSSDKFSDFIVLYKDTEVGLIGDINDDGKINNKDWSLLYLYINGTKEFTSEQLARADVNGDGKVNNKDWNRLYNHINETDKLD